MINIAILGFGLIGSGVADVLSENESVISKKLGDKVNVKYILDIKKIDDEKYAGKLTGDIETVVNDPEISVVVETMGGSHPAYEYTMAALVKGISVVTSNKEVVANYGAALLAAAVQNNARYFFEASVGGGIPVIRPMYNCLAANKIKSITAILNGTTNYILSKMEKDGLPFARALEDAQQKGYAERNPAADVEGADSCRKISILSSLAFGKHLPPAKIHTEGVAGVAPEDIENAKKLGCKIKLIASSRNDAGDDGLSLSAIVAPMLVPSGHPLYSIEDVFNGIVVNGNIIGDVMFYGRGAGKLPTASAVVADIIDALGGGTKNICWEESDGGFISDYRLSEFRYYMRGARISPDTPGLKSLPCAGSIEYCYDSDNDGFFLTTPPLNLQSADNLRAALLENEFAVFSAFRML